MAIVIRGAGNRWLNNLIPYEIDSSILPSLPRHRAAACRMLDAAVEQWNTRTPISLEPRRDQPDYVVFRNSPEIGSHVGRRGGKQIIHCDFNQVDFTDPHSTHTPALMQEIGHAIGFWHEQCRSDRDQFVEILEDNIKDDKKFFFEKRVGMGVDIGKYDYLSIMHNSSTAFSKNGQPTIRSLFESSLHFGGVVHLSELDVKAAWEVFGDLVGTFSFGEVRAGDIRLITKIIKNSSALPLEVNLTPRLAVPFRMISAQSATVAPGTSFAMVVELAVPRDFEELRLSGSIDIQTPVLSAVHSMQVSGQVTSKKKRA